MGKVINDVTSEGLEMGYHLSRWAEAEEQKGPLPGNRERCNTCAFRCGTYASGSPTTTMDALKCVMEGVPFLCHDDHKLCAGYALLRRSGEKARKTEVNWPFSDEVA
jgi:hypothetical protein